MKNEKVIALLAKHNGYVGREYAKALLDANISFYYIQFGDYDILDEDENRRCGGLWSAPIIDEHSDCKIMRFQYLKAKQLKKFIEKNNITLAIQGGVDVILKQEVIDIFSDGILNFHPGDLPYYRGCSAPEWQIYDFKKVICTSHFVDKGIDTGNIIEKKVLDICEESYEKMRASIYPQISKFVVKIVRDYVNDIKLQGSAQSKGINRQYIGDEKIAEISRRMAK
jgi:folate-dependent phosphoribosylglycinamide formyltransferase PurN